VPTLTIYCPYVVVWVFHEVTSEGYSIRNYTTTNAGRSIINPYLHLSYSPTKKWWIISFVVRNSIFYCKEKVAKLTIILPIGYLWAFISYSGAFLLDPLGQCINLPLFKKISKILPNFIF